MIRVVTWNVNGLASVERSGALSGVIEQLSPDVLALQETKVAGPGLQLPLAALGYSAVSNSSCRPGRAGVALLTRDLPLAVERVLGYERFDEEGRFLKAQIRNLTLINVYMPHGNRDQRDIPHKLAAYKALLSYIRRASYARCLLVGDFNVARSDLDVARYTYNHGHTMFTNDERRALEELTEIGLVDVLRKVHPDRRFYTWWPYAFNARARNIGWRIDYIFASPSLMGSVSDVATCPDLLGSDHCPLYVDVEL